MSNLETFAFESHAVRTALIDDEPWFVATDVAKILGYKLASDMCKMLDDDEKGMHNLHTPSSNQHGHAGTQETSVTVISESGLYAAILKSRRPEAKKFRKWVTSEVLPSLRKHGHYEMPRVASSSMPPSVSHRADHVVSATRCFNGLMRAAAALRIGQGRAALAANQAAIRHTGVDVLGELGIEPEELPVDAPCSTQDDTLPLIKEWLATPERATVNRFTCEEIVAGVFDIAPGDAEYRSAVTRAGIAMARIGWQHRRSSGPGRKYYYLRPATAG